MEETGVKRKLAVILAADVEGYSRLMGVDEEATLKTLSAYREIIDGLIIRHDGRVFGTAGDSVVAEFASPVSPRASIEDLRERWPFKDQAVLERYLEALRKAGLPEKSRSTAP